MGVSPVLIDTTVKKSGDALPPITVSNGTAEDYEIEVSFAPLQHDIDGSPELAPPSYKYSADKLLSTKTAKFKLTPGEKKPITVNVQVPAGRTGGGYAYVY